MKKTLVILAYACLAFSPLAGQAKLDLKGFETERELKDESEINQALVVISVQTLLLQGQKLGPIHLSFAKVLPVIGPRLWPSRKYDLKRLNTCFFYFDQVNIGETYKLYDYSWQELNYNIRACPGIMGTDFTAKIISPGLLYMGAYVQGEKNGLQKDYSVTEIDAMNNMSEYLSAYPRWKKIVDARIKELTQ